MRLFLDYNSCSYESLDLWEAGATLEDGTRISIIERYRPPQNEEFGPIRMQRGDVTLRGQRRSTSSYWNLVYSASRHNTFVRHWILLDPPVEVEGFDEPVAIVELVAPQIAPAPPYCSGMLLGAFPHLSRIFLSLLPQNKSNNFPLKNVRKKR